MCAAAALDCGNATEAWLNVELHASEEPVHLWAYVSSAVRPGFPFFLFIG